MKTQVKAGMDIIQGKDVGARPMRQLSGHLLRFVVFVLTLVAAILMGVAKETTMINIKLAPTLPTISVIMIAKSSYSPDFVYFVIVNAISCGYSALSLAISIINKGKRMILALAITSIDLVMVALLFSGNGVAVAIGEVGKNGNSHMQWNKICDNYGKFCANITVDVSILLLGLLAYLILTLLTVVGLYRGSK